jgi:aminoglycoside 6'-N-acetyltransferase
LQIPLEITIEPQEGTTSFTVAAYEDGVRIGYAYVHELPRRHRGRSMLFVYDVEVSESHRGRGVGKAMLARLDELARERGIAEGFVLTEPDNAAANALYRSAGGTRVDVVMWDFSYVRGERTSLRPAGEDDVDRLVAWHADPDVSRYWDDETFTREEMAGRLEREDVDAWIVEADGDPVGYLQTHPAGLDMFLIPSARGRGLGPDAARAMTDHLLAQGRTRVTVDPYAWNESAVRAWQRAGFVEVARHPPDEEHTAEWIEMEYRPDAAR